MSETKEAKVLGAYETIRIGFEGGETAYLEISGNGTFSYDFGTHGDSFNLFQSSSKDAQGSLANYQNTRHEPSKADKIANYLYMLFEAQKNGHMVHNEIESSLSEYKKELGV